MARDLKNNIRIFLSFSLAHIHRAMRCIDYELEIEAPHISKFIECIFLPILFKWFSSSREKQGGKAEARIHLLALWTLLPSNKMWSEKRARIRRRVLLAKISVDDGNSLAPIETLQRLSLRKKFWPSNLGELPKRVCSTGRFAECQFRKLLH